MLDEQKRSVQSSLRATWLHALGVLTGAESEVLSAAHRVLEAVGLSAEGAGGHGAGTAESHGAHRTAAFEILARVKHNREALERRVDEGVKAAVARVRGPLEGEMAALRGRVEKLSRAVDDLRRKPPAPGAGHAGQAAPRKKK